MSDFSVHTNIGDIEDVHSNNYEYAQACLVFARLTIALLDFEHYTIHLSGLSAPSPQIRSSTSTGIHLLPRVIT